jgi:hypothetical protein
VAPSAPTDANMISRRAQRHRDFRLSDLTCVITFSINQQVQRTLAEHKWRRLVYENMENALIRGNDFWMSPLLPKINPTATSE